MTHLLALALAILAAASATAQGRPLTYSAPEIKGQIVDEQSGAPLGGAWCLPSGR